MDLESIRLPEALLPATDPPPGTDKSDCVVRLRGNSDQYSPAIGNDTFILPGGLTHEGQPLKKVRLRPVTGMDEEQFGTAEARRHKWRMVDVILSRQITAIEDITDQNQIERLVPRLLVGDRTMLLVMLHKISESDFAILSMTCERCQHTWNHQLDLDHMLYDVYLGDRVPPTVITGELPIGYRDADGTVHRSFRLKLLDGFTERVVENAGENIGVVRTNILVNCLESLGTLENVAEHEMRSLIKKDRAHLDTVQSSFTPGPQILYKIPCEKCDRQTTALVRPEAFFGF